MVLVVMQWQPSWISNKRLSNDYLYTDLIKLLVSENFLSFSRLCFDYFLQW